MQHHITSSTNFSNNTYNSNSSNNNVYNTDDSMNVIDFKDLNENTLRQLRENYNNSKNNTQTETTKIDNSNNNNNKNFDIRSIEYLDISNIINVNQNINGIKNINTNNSVKALAGASNGTLYVLNINDNIIEVENTYKFTNSQINSIKFFKDDNLIVLFYANGEILFLELFFKRTLENESKVDNNLTDFKINIKELGNNKIHNTFITSYIIKESSSNLKNNIKKVKLITSSWDNTIKYTEYIIQNNKIQVENKTTLHCKNYVWCVKEINIHIKELKYTIIITCDTVGYIKFYLIDNLDELNGEKNFLELYRYKISNKCVRKIILLNDNPIILDDYNKIIEYLKNEVCLITCINDGQIFLHTGSKILWYFDTKSLIYDAIVIKNDKINKLIVSCNENNIFDFDFIYDHNTENINNLSIVRKILYKTNCETNWQTKYINENLLISGGNSNSFTVFILCNAKEKNVNYIDLNHSHTISVDLKSNEYKTSKFSNKPVNIDTLKTNLPEFKNTSNSSNILNYIKNEENKKSFNIELNKKYYLFEFIDNKNLKEYENMKNPFDLYLDKVSKSFLIINGLDLYHKNEIKNFVYKKFNIINSKHNTFNNNINLIDSDFDKMNEFFYSDISIRNVYNKLNSLELYKTCKEVENNRENIILLLKLCKQEMSTDKFSIVELDQLIKKVVKALELAVIDENINREIYFVIIDIVRYLILFIGIDINPYHFLNVTLNKIYNNFNTRKITMTFYRLLINLLLLNITDYKILQHNYDFLSKIIKSKIIDTTELTSYMGINEYIKIRQIFKIFQKYEKN